MVLSWPTIPHRYDYLLRLENMTAGWKDLVQHYKLPLVRIPWLNGLSFAPGDPTPPSAQLTAEIIDIINRLEGPIFTQFGYPKRI